MIHPPKTIEQAQKIKYNRWAGKPKGEDYKEGRCAYEVFGAWLSYQCTRKNGHGPSGLYCKQHSKIL